MATNLIPIHLDKNTGGLVAKDSGTGFAMSYTHTQGAAALTWTIKHNNSTENFILQVYNTSDKVVIPDEIVVVDINTVRVSFAVAQAGKATMVLFV